MSSEDHVRIPMGEQEKQQLSICVSSDGSSHKVLMEMEVEVNVYSVEYIRFKRNRDEMNKFVVYEVLKIFQICVCVFFMIVGIILTIVSLWTGRDRLYYYPLSTTWHEQSWTSPFDIFLWYCNISSIFGFLAADNDCRCLQIIYAILTIPFIPYSFIPWLLVHALFEGWHKPPAPLRFIKRVR